jgi:hypothetical protein
MTGHHHFDWEQIVDRVEGRVPSDAEFRNHMQVCSSCGAVKAEAERMRDAMLLAGTPEPGPRLVARTWARILEDAVVQRARDFAAGVRAAVEEVWATLSADSLLPSAAVRGIDHATPRLLVYETPEYSVSLSFYAAGKTGATDIVGQVVPKNAPELPGGGQVRISDQPDLYHVTDFGEFRISGVEVTESTRLTVAFPDLHIHIGPLPLLREG